MSELKAETFYLERESGERYAVEFYIKSEADKVIAELKQKINEAQTELELWRDGSIISEAHQKELDGKRHSDYKRCLAMAAVCFEKSYSTTLVKYDKESGLLRNFYDWWGNCWLALAEEPTLAKFLQLIRKEAK